LSGLLRTIPNPEDAPMPLIVERRKFTGGLLTAGLGSIVAAPSLGSLNPFALLGGADVVNDSSPSLDLFSEHIAALHASERDPFQAQANLLAIVEILGIAASLVTILEYFGVIPSWVTRPRYGQAGGCTPHFQRDETRFRELGLTSFIDIGRSRSDHDAAILGAKSKRSAGYAAQYADAPSQRIAGKAVSAVQVAMDHQSRKYGLDRAAVVKTATPLKVFDKRSETKTEIELRNASGGYIKYHLCEDCIRKGRDFGIVGVHTPGYTNEAEPDYIPMKQRPA
jgi:hypothetical protein